MTPLKGGEMTTHNDSFPVQFVTLTVCGWKHLFVNEACARVVLDSLAWMSRTGQWILLGFVLLPSHLHLLIRPIRKSARAGAESFADFTAGRMVSILRKCGRHPLLHYLHSKGDAGKPGAPIWAEIRLREVKDPREALRLLDYMHNKPASGEWKLVSDRSGYLYSSACFYDRGEIPIIPVEDLREFHGE